MYYEEAVGIDRGLEVGKELKDEEGMRNADEGPNDEQGKDTDTGRKDILVEEKHEELASRRRDLRPVFHENHSKASIRGCSLGLGAIRLELEGDESRYKADEVSMDLLRELEEEREEVQR